MSSFQNLLLKYFEYLFQDTGALVYSSPQWMMKPNQQAILLDCGCGNGQFSIDMARLLGTTHAIGIELNVRLALQARASGVKTLCADLNGTFPFQDQSVHVVAAFNVLEHLTETELFLQEIYRILVPGGYTIIDTPNLASWHNIAALVIGLQPFSGPNITSMTESDVPIVRRMHRRAHGIAEDEEYYRTSEPERHRHLVVVAYRSLIKAMQRAGFVIDEAVGYGYYPFPPLIARLLSRIDPWHSHHMTIKARKP
jgi:SAM-dependent methyltransferase